MDFNVLKGKYDRARETRQGPGSGWRVVNGPKAPVIDAYLNGDTISLRYRFNGRDGQRNCTNMFAEISQDNTARFTRFYPSQVSMKIAHWLGLNMAKDGDSWRFFDYHHGRQYQDVYGSDFPARWDLARGKWVPVPTDSLKPKHRWLEEVYRRAYALCTNAIPDGDERLAELQFKHALLGTRPDPRSHPSVKAWVACMGPMPKFTDAIVTYVYEAGVGLLYAHALEHANHEPPKGWTPWTK